MMTCQSCGATDVTDGLACPTCGTIVQVAPPPEPPGAGSPPPPAMPPVPPVPPVPATGPIRRPATDPSHPSGMSSDARTYATFIHLSAFAAAMVAFAFVGPLIMWLLKREEHPYFDQHGKEATNFNLSFFLYGVVAVILAVVTLGIGLLVIIPVGLVFGIVWIVAIIQAAIAANRGQAYRYPLSIRFIT